MPRASMAAEVMRTPPRRRHRGKSPKSPKPETANGGRPSALRKPDGPSERLQAYLKQRKEAKAAKKMGEKDKTDEKKGKRKEDSSKKEDPEKKGAKDNKKLKKEDPDCGRPGVHSRTFWIQDLHQLRKTQLKYPEAELGWETLRL